MLADSVKATDAAADGADQSVAAADEVRDNPLRKADEQSKAAEAEHDALSRGHDEEKDKHEEQTKGFVARLKEQYGKAPRARERRCRGPLGEAVGKSGVSIDKSAGILLSQARGAIDEVMAAYGEAKSAYDGAQKERGDLADAGLAGPGDPRPRRERVLSPEGGITRRRTRPPAEAKKTLAEHEKEIEAEAEKITARGGGGGEARAGGARSGEAADGGEQGAVPRDADAQRDFRGGRRGDRRRRAARSARRSRRRRAAHRRGEPRWARARCRTTSA